MDPRERMDSPLVAARAMLRGWQSDIWTALPAIVQSYDATKGTVSACPSVQLQVRSPEGVWATVSPQPVCLDCPVSFPWGGGFGVSLPLAAGDEGMLVFSSRCIDGWWQNGGIQPQAEFRLHDLSDGMFIPGMFSQPKVPPALSATALQVRSLDGHSLIHLSATDLHLMLLNGALQIKLDSATGRVNITATGGLWVNGVQVTVP